MDNYPKCPKCDCTTFQVRDYDATGATARLFCCAKCGAVLGVTGFVEDEQRLALIAQMIGRIARQLSPG